MGNSYFNFKFLGILIKYCQSKSTADLNFYALHQEFSTSMVSFNGTQKVLSVTSMKLTSHQNTVSFLGDYIKPYVTCQVSFS